MTTTLTIYAGPYRHDTSIGTLRCDRELPAATIEYIADTIRQLDLTASRVLAAHLNGEAPPIIESLLDPFRYCEVCGNHPVTFLHRLRPNGRDIWRRPCHHTEDDA